MPEHEVLKCGSSQEVVIEGRSVVIAEPDVEPLEEDARARAARAARAHAYRQVGELFERFACEPPCRLVVSLVDRSGPIVTGQTRTHIRGRPEPGGKWEPHAYNDYEADGLMRLTILVECLGGG